MELKVREVTGEESKSKQEIEEALIKKAEEKNQGNQQPEEGNDAPIDKTPKLGDEDVLSFIKEKYNKSFSSVDELFKKEEPKQELPEDVAAFLKYKQETGRGLDDFSKLNRDIDSMDSDKLLKDYLLATESGLDEEDIDLLMEEDYSFDDEVDSDSEVRKKKLKKKQDIAKAKEYFESQKEKYKAPLESSGSSIPDEDKEAFEQYKQYMQEATTYEEKAKRERDWFLKKTDDVFNDEFKGFEFTVGDGKKITYSPDESATLKKVQSNPSAFVQKFLNEDGLLEDAVGYHKALSIAMNPEKFAEYFYKQGASHATEDTIREQKNIDMQTRKSPDLANKGGAKIRAVNPNSGNGLKIIKRK